MKNVLHRRFIERDHVKRQIESSSEYISPDNIESILSEREDWSDYTFWFTPKGTGWSTKVFCNIYEYEVSLDDLNSFAMDYYIRQLVDLTKEKYLIPEELSVAI